MHLVLKCVTNTMLDPVITGSSNTLLNRHSKCYKQTKELTELIHINMKVNVKVRGTVEKENFLT